MEIEFSDKKVFPLLSSYGRNEEITSGADMVRKAERNVLELHFGSEYVSMADIEPYFTNLNETASVLKIYEDGQQYIYTDYVIPIKCSREYFEGSANPRIIMILGQLSETDKTLRDIAPQKIYTGTQLDIARAKKIDEMDRKCRDTIYGGTLVPLSSGIAERFTLDEQDQLNLSGIALKILMGADTVSWHTNDKSEHCVFYSAADAKAIISTLTAFKEYHITYFRDLRIFINSLTEIDAVNGIEYGYLLPEEYKSDVLKQMEAMM